MFHVYIFMGKYSDWFNRRGIESVERDNLTYIMLDQRGFSPQEFIETFNARIISISADLTQSKYNIFIDVRENPRKT